MRILLISANTETINMPVLPLGLGHIAASVQKAGHDLKLLNLLEQKDVTVFDDSVAEFDPDIIGISVRNIDDQNMENPKFLLEPVKSIISACRNISAAPIVLGGAGYSIFPRAALDYLGADMGIRGEGEVAFLNLLKRLDAKKEPKGIPGLYVPRQGIFREPERIKRLADYPLPLPNIDLCIPSNLEKEETWLPIQTRRGCPMNCSYCSTAQIEGHIIRKYPSEKVVETISQCVSSGFDKFFFVDNTFNIPPSYAKSLCDQLASANLDIKWRCIMYPWKVDKELVAKMALAGCSDVSLGFESGSSVMLHRMNKKYHLEEVRKISKALKASGIRRMGFLLLGGPGETKDTVIESLTYADELDLEAVKVTLGIRIYPRTPLARTAVEEGIIESDDDLLFPKFYMVENLKDWLIETVGDWLERHPNFMR